MDDTAGRDIAGIAIAVVAVVSFIAVVSPTSAPVSNAIAGFYHLGFGLGAYVLPFALLIFAAGLFLRDRAPLNARTLLGGSLILLGVLAILSLMVPGTEFATSAMFEAEALSTSGGYVGAFIASALQQALGKTISLVVLIGLIIVGFVVIGFSVSSFMRAAADRARELAERRRVNVNDAPWGDEGALQPAQGRSAFGGAAVQGNLFDDAGAAETTFLGNRETTVLDSASGASAPAIEDDPDRDEDPFVDLSSQLAAERAETTLIPVPDRFDHVDAPTKADGGEAPSTTADSLVDDEEIPPFDVDGAAPSVVKTADGPREIPSFLKSHAPASGSDGAAKEVRPSKTSAPAAADSEEPEDGQLQLPPLSMLRHNPHSAVAASSDKELEQTANSLQSTLNEFGLHSRVVGWISGPTVTTFKVQPGEGERVSRISNLEDDIALSLAAQSVRIFAPIPGTSLVGIEIPNAKRQNVNLGDVLPYVQGGPLELAIGRDAEGQPIVADLAKMPHLLIAGTTGSGKSVMINSIIMALLMRSLPEDVRLIMVDPKRVELSGYNGLPHLYVPVVTEPKQAASALQWAVSEMERRLKVFERIGVRKISTFNEKQAAGEFDHYDNPPAKMPYLVIIIDELSDLMMVAGKDVEASIVRIAQLGRAAGIHLIVATQRPSSNVVTGLIKANITNRIAFNVATGIDSRVIIDQMGAEKLTGYGDMLFSKVDWGKPKRIQGCFVSDDEINGVVDFVKEQGAPDYHEEILSAVAPATMSGGGGGGFYNEAPTEEDPLLWDAAKIVVESQLGSTSGLQRRLKVGYARAGRIMDMLEEKGIVGPPDGSKPREVLYDEEGLAALRAVEEPLSEEEIFGGM
ncbi:FtsK/SpoIIIE family DNA translocase [Collinsella intestinalis]|uniref:DNA translocase FtsK n=1 Tax=Collinsella intestinalis TaxID=147207 RepID=A0A414NHJ7_9ACTN|nr:DNA translocase FtsK [Collinsella intestinalis]RHF39229.1 DNA translocase FtsK [Collinsella intestinalis]